MRNRLSTRAKVAGAVGALVILATGCRPPEEFPAEPVIAFKSFTQHGDSASFVITFTDGDGDIGLSDADSEAPFDTGGAYYHNLFLEYDSLSNGVWTRVNFFLPLYYRLPRITPTGQNKALEGEIAVAIEPWPIIPGSQTDTIRIGATLVDRALHVSNAASSGVVVVQ